MEPLVEPVPESRLADVLLGELCPRQEADDTYVDIILEDLELVEPDDDDDEYALFQVVRDPFATTEFVRVRDTSRDHVVTVKFPRSVLEDETAEIPQVSAPYERIEIETIIVEPEPEACVSERLARGTDASSIIVAQSVPEADAPRVAGRLARGTDASSLVAQNVPGVTMPGVLARGVLAPKVVVPRVIAPKVVARVPGVAPRGADTSRVPERIARGTDASNLVVAPSVPEVAPRGADMPDGIDVWFDEPEQSISDAHESEAIDPMPDILDVWLDESNEAPAEVREEPREESGARFMAYANALPFPLYSAPFERVELGELPAVAQAWPDDATDVLVPRRSTATRVIRTILVLTCALALGLGLALLVMRAST